MRFEVDLAHVLLGSKQIDDSQYIEFLTELFVCFLVQSVASRGFASAAAATSGRECRCPPKVEELVTKDVPQCKVRLKLVFYGFVLILFIWSEQLVEILSCISVHLACMIVFNNFSVKLFDHAIGKREVLKVSETVVRERSQECEEATKQRE